MRQETIETKVQVRLAALREPHKGVILQSQTGEELDAFLPSVLDRAFKGELCPLPVLPPNPKCGFRGRGIESWNETRDNQF